MEAIKRFGVLVILLMAALACNTPPLANTTPEVARTEQPTVVIVVPNGGNDHEDIVPQTPNPPPERSQQIDGLISEVSAERLLQSVQALATIPTRHVNSPESQRAAAVIFDLFEAAGGRLQIGYQDFPLSFNGQDTVQRNVVATLPGTSADAGVILVGAHYDSRTIDINDAESPAPGANDNASGVAGIIELATVLANESFPQTIVFVAFAAEEVGAWGARAYVERNPLPEAVIVLDIIGNSAGPAGETVIRVFSAPPDQAGQDSSSRALARLADYNADIYTPNLNVALQATVDRPGRFSDHVPFSDAGAPAMRFIELIEDVDRQHSAIDFPQYISASYLQQSTRLALASVINLAQGHTRPVLNVVDGQVQWDTVPSAAGYVIAQQSTTGVDDITYQRVSSEVNQVNPDVGVDVVSVAIIASDGTVGRFQSIVVTP